MKKLGKGGVAGIVVGAIAALAAVTGIVIHKRKADEVRPLAEEDINEEEPEEEEVTEE